jgi:large repetitive protein
MVQSGRHLLRAAAAVLSARRLVHLLWSFAILVAFSVAAQAGPFTCSGSVYQVQSGQLKIFDPLTSTYVNIGAATSNYNAAGFSTLDNYAYAMQSNNLIRINSDGSVNVLFAIGSTSNAGDMDTSGNLVIKNSTTSLKKINITTGAQTTVTLTGTALNAADIAWAQSGATQYMIGFENSGFISVVNLTTNVVTSTAVSGLPATTGYGASWRDSAGRIFTFNNTTGIIYEVTNYLTASPVAVQVAVGIPSGNNDGFSCPTAPFPNLPPLAFNDPFTTAFNTAVSGNVISNNGNGLDRDPEGTAITVTTTPIVGPTNGSVVLAANGAFTYTPSSAFFGVDTFTYRITDASGLTATAVVTITVSPPIANLVTVKTRLSATGTPSVGGTVQYQIKVTNSGPDAVPNPSLTDSLPAGLTYTANTVTQGSYVPGTGVWTIGALANGATATLTLSGTVNSGQEGQTITNNTTRASGGQTDPTTTGDDLTETVVVTLASHSIVKTQSSGPNPVTAVGQTLGYTITVDNIGNVALSSVVVTDQLLLGAAARTLTTGPTRTSGDTNSNNIMETTEVWVYAATYVVTQADLNATGSFSNTATVSSAQTGAVVTTAVTTPVTRTPRLTIVKTADTPGPVNLNTLITYTYMVSNTGNVTINNVSVNDVHNGTGTPHPIPDLETLTTDAAPTGDSTDVTSTDVLWSTLAPGDTVRFRGTYTVTQADIDTLQ